MPSASLLEKLDPDRYPNMSMTFVAILGYLCEETWTQPVILSIEVVDDVKNEGRTKAAPSEVAGRKGGPGLAAGWRGQPSRSIRFTPNPQRPLAGSSSKPANG